MFYLFILATSQLLKFNVSETETTYPITFWASENPNAKCQVTLDSEAYNFEKCSFEINTLNYQQKQTVFAIPKPFGRNTTVFVSVFCDLNVPMNNTKFQVEPKIESVKKTCMVLGTGRYVPFLSNDAFLFQGSGDYYFVKSPFLTIQLQNHVQGRVSHVISVFVRAGSDVFVLDATAKDLSRAVVSATGKLKNVVASWTNTRLNYLYNLDFWDGSTLRTVIVPGTNQSVPYIAMTFTASKHLKSTGICENQKMLVPRNDTLAYCRNQCYGQTELPVFNLCNQIIEDVPPPNGFQKSNDFDSYQEKPKVDLINVTLPEMPADVKAAAFNACDSKIPSVESSVPRRVYLDSCREGVQNQMNLEETCSINKQLYMYQVSQQVISNDTVQAQQIAETYSFGGQECHQDCGKCSDQGCLFCTKNTMEPRDGTCKPRINVTESKFFLKSAPEIDENGIMPKTSGAQRL